MILSKAVFLNRLYLDSEEFTVWESVQITGQILQVPVGLVGDIAPIPGCRLIVLLH